MLNVSMSLLVDRYGSGQTSILQTDKFTDRQNILYASINQKILVEQLQETVKMITMTTYTANTDTTNFASCQNRQTKTYLMRQTHDATMW